MYQILHNKKCLKSIGMVRYHKNMSRIFCKFLTRGVCPELNTQKRWAFDTQEVNKGRK